MIRMSCAVAMTAASPNRISKRNARYISVRMNEKITACRAFVCSSAPTFAPTNSVLTHFHAAVGQVRCDRSLEGLGDLGD